MTTINPLLTQFDTKHNTPPFSQIKEEHYKPAFVESIASGKAEIEKIAQIENPTFENTIVALEFAGAQLDKVAEVFFNLTYANTNDELQRIAEEVSPMLSEFSNDIYLNETLFAKVKQVHDQGNEGLDDEQKMLLDKTYKAFTRNGALLDDDKKERFREISKQLSVLGVKFGQNVLAETNAFKLHITEEADLSGLPKGVIEAAAEQAKADGNEGWVFNLNFPSYLPFMKYADKRELREQMFKAYTARGNNGNEADNKENINKIVNLRLERAKILGYGTFADMILEERMAGSSSTVFSFLDELLEAAMPFAVKEKEELDAYAKENGADFKLERWDWAYYAEKLKESKFDLNEEMTKPYFQLSKVKQGVFDLCAKLYGLSFSETDEVEKYHDDVHVYEVFDETGDFLSVLYLDFHPRESKQGGAWMTSFASQMKKDGQDVRPQVSVVCNFTKPTETTPSLLTFDEVTTFLHEFGHALHGMLSRCTYPSLSGTSVYRDFVELPSQIFENWALEKEWLQDVAVHYQTGERIPDELIQKIIDSRNFLSGYQCVRQLSFGFNDMAWHSIADNFNGEVADFEKEAMEKTELFEHSQNSVMSCSFAHIFSGGYAAGYYGYKWAEVLDADAFSVFKEKGIFDKQTADSFRQNILEKGGSQHPMTLYKNFRGQEPHVDALLERSGLK